MPERRNRRYSGHRNGKECNHRTRENSLKTADVAQEPWFFIVSISTAAYTLSIMSISSPPHKPVEVAIKVDQQRAIVEGKTTVPFQSFVTLILQRKVLPLIKQWGREPVIVNSELLAGLASAPQDSTENRTKLLLVTLGIGIVLGIFILSSVQLALSLLRVSLRQRELLLLAGGILGFAVLTALLGRIQRTKRNDRIEETIEKIASMLPK